MFWLCLPETQVNINAQFFYVALMAVLCSCYIKLMTCEIMSNFFLSILYKLTSLLGLFIKPTFVLLYCGVEVMW